MSSIDNKLKEINYNMGLIYDKAYNEGKNSVENYLPYAETARFRDLNLFGKSEVIIDMPLLVEGGSMFRQVVVNETVEHLTVNSQTQLTNITMMFYCDGAFINTKLKHITLNADTSKATYTDNIFGGNSGLEIVDGSPIDLSSSTTTTTRIGYATSKLSHIRFVPNTIKCNLNASDSKVYSFGSIQSIIDGLAIVETAKTLNLNAGQNILQSQVNSANLKGWTVTGGTIVSEEW